MTDGEHHDLLKQAYKMRYSKKRGDLEKQQREIWKSLQVLSLPGAAYRYFQETAQYAVANGVAFNELEIECVNFPANLERTFTWRQIRDATRTIRRGLVDNRSNFDQLLHIEYSDEVDRDSFPTHCHADIKILTYVEMKLAEDERPYPYFGVSKLSCWLCHDFLKAFHSQKRSYNITHYRTRGCHGTVRAKCDLGLLRNFDNAHVMSCLIKYQIR
jgi:hypothetical protein